MKKSKLNLIIDALLLVCIAAIAGIGLLMRNVLIPGYKRWEIYNSNVELHFWGLDRHQWGTIHFIIALVLLALLVLHIVLHWGMLVSIYRTLVPNPFGRCVIAVILVCLTIFLLMFSFLVRPEVQERGYGKGHGWQLYEPQMYSTQKR